MKKLSIIIGIIFVLLGIAFEVYLLVAFGGKPVSEIPAWALMFMMKS